MNKTFVSKVVANRESHCMAAVAAFTLVEVLVVTSVLAVLVTLVTTGTQAALTSAEKSREVAAGRNLIVAYQLAASENSGEYLPGYDRTVSEVSLPEGRTVHGPAANRYPFRLAPYFNNDLEGTIFVNRNATQVKRSDSYSVSLYPAFGINYLYVGGDKSSEGKLTIPNDVVTRAASGANIIAFASSGTEAASEIIHGYSILTPPATYGSMWSNADWSPDSAPNAFGHIHARHSGKAVCVFLDGSIRMLGIEELRDMRLWSKEAQANNEPDYRVTPPAPTPGRR